MAASPLICVPGLGVYVVGSVYLMRDAIRGHQRSSEVIRGHQYVVGSVYSSACIVAIERQYMVPKVT